MDLSEMEALGFHVILHRRLDATEHPPPVHGPATRAAARLRLMLDRRHVGRRVDGPSRAQDDPGTARRVIVAKAQSEGIPEPDLEAGADWIGVSRVHAVPKGNVAAEEFWRWSTGPPMSQQHEGCALRLSQLLTPQTLQDAQFLVATLRHEGFSDSEIRAALTRLHVVRFAHAFGEEPRPRWFWIAVPAEVEPWKRLDWAHVEDADATLPIPASPKAIYAENTLAKRQCKFCETTDLGFLPIGPGPYACGSCASGYKASPRKKRAQKTRAKVSLPRRERARSA